MSILKTTEEEFRNHGNGKPINKIYLLDNQEIEGTISHYSVGPLRLLTYVLDTKGIKYNMNIEGSNPWKIQSIEFDQSHSLFIEQALKEVMEYRCAVELGNEYEKIIRQLPFEVAMETSQIIMQYGKAKSSKKEKIANLNSLNYSNLILNNAILIPENEPQKRKHLIYPSARGGYNIKTLGYDDDNLDNYCYTDSKKWD